MKSDSIKGWLKKKKSWGFAQQEFFGVTGLLCGIVIVFLTFWFTYAVIWFGWYGISAASELIFNKKLSDIPHVGRLIGSGIFVVLLFVQHFRTNPFYWGDYPRRDYTSPDAVKWQVALDYYTGFGSLLINSGASANMITDILMTGPRLVTSGSRMIRQGFRVRSIDENGCAQLLSFMLSQAHAVPYDELRAAGWQPFLDQLHCIEGVDFLQKGLLLSDDLRTELNQLPAT